MIFHPLIIALCMASILTGFMVLYSSWFGIQVMTKWDLQSGSEAQLVLERKTYLISTLLACLFGFQILSFFLYIFTADQLHGFFVGAMCAAGSLYVNAFGYPTLLLKIVNFLAAGLWLILNYVDNKGYDYPLIRWKYALLLCIAPLIVVEAVWQAKYFLGMNPDIITSCCGTLFSPSSQGLAADIVSLPIRPTEAGFFLSMLITVASGWYFFRKARGARFFGWMCVITLVVSILSMLSFIPVYFYELPTHHCPFCILQREYGYVGYPLYIALLGGTLSGMGVGITSVVGKKAASLVDVIPMVQRRLSVVSIVLLLSFTAIVIAGMCFSNMRLG